MLTSAKRNQGGLSLVELPEQGDDACGWTHCACFVTGQGIWSAHPRTRQPAVVGGRGPRG